MICPPNLQPPGDDGQMLMETERRLLGPTARNLSRMATLAGAGEEDNFNKCFDDITGKELQAVKQAREQELKHLCEIGVYEKVDAHAAVAKYDDTPIDTTWVDSDNAFEEEPTQIRFRIVARELKCGDSPASRRLIMNGQRGYWTVEEEHVRYQRCSEQLGTRLARASRKLGLRAGAQFKTPIPQQEREDVGFDTRRRLCGDRNEGESVGAQEAAGERVPNQSEHHRGRSGNALNRRVRWGETGIVYQHDPRHVDVHVESLRLGNGNTVQTRIVDDVQDENSV